jgi:hypothetical protein
MGALDGLTGVANNRQTSVQKVIAVALSVLVQGAALTAPLVHAHPDDHATAHHAGRTVHTHWGGHGHSHPLHRSNAPTLDNPDDDRPLFLNALVAVTVVIPATPAAIQASSDLPVPRERVRHRSFDVVRSHDPPSVTRQSPRAPPSLPVLI